MKNFFRDLQKPVKIIIASLLVLLLAAGAYIWKSWDITYSARANYVNNLTVYLSVLASDLENKKEGDILHNTVAERASMIEGCIWTGNVLNYAHGFERRSFTYGLHGGDNIVLDVMRRIVRLADGKPLGEKEIVYLHAVAEECKKLHDAFFVLDGNMYQLRRTRMSARFYQEQFKDFNALFGDGFGGMITFDLPNRE